MALNQLKTMLDQAAQLPACAAGAASLAKASQAITEAMSAITAQPQQPGPTQSPQY
jgi:hypothetical protein